MENQEYNNAFQKLGEGKVYGQLCSIAHDFVLKKDCVKPVGSKSNYIQIDKFLEKFNKDNKYKTAQAAE